jgi:hypothetical protein
MASWWRVALLPRVGTVPVQQGREFSEKDVSYSPRMCDVLERLFN